MSCRVSAAGSRLRRFMWLSNLVLCIAESGHKCKEPKKHLDYYIRFNCLFMFSWTFFVYVELAYHSECECESDGRLTHVKTNTLQIN